MRLMGNASVGRGVRRVCRAQRELSLPYDLAYEPVHEVVASTAHGGDLRVAFFPDAYNEVDGVANVSRHLEAFARSRGLPFLTIHAGPDRKMTTDGSLTRLPLRRSWLAFPLDRAHEYDLGFWRYYGQVMETVREFAPDLVQITGPSDLSPSGMSAA